LYKLYDRYREEGMPMPYTKEEFIREAQEQMLKDPEILEEMRKSPDLAERLVDDPATIRRVAREPEKYDPVVRDAVVRRVTGALVRQLAKNPAVVLQILEGVPVERRLEGVPVEKRLEGVPVEDLLKAIPPQPREALRQRLQADDSSGQS
jgi:hypothetical protein